MKRLFKLSALLWSIIFLNSCTKCQDPIPGECDSNIEVFTFVEKMPSYPGGVDSLNSFITTNLVYPESAKITEVNGKVSAKFIIDTNGNVICPEIITSLTPDCDKEVLRLLHLMPKWNPGTHNQFSVFVSLGMYFEFVYDSTKYDQTYTFVEQMPQFPGGEVEMIAFIKNNLVYPDSAKINKIEGTVVVQFVVDKYGNLISPYVVRGISPDCDQEVLRIISIMPNWIPGRHNGKAVKVSFTLPIRFKLP